jgi:zinc protease
MKQFAASTLTDNSRVVMYAIKGKKIIDDPPKKTEVEKTSNVASLNIPNQEWRRTPPAAGPISKLTLPVPRQFTLSNGLTVLLTEEHSLPVVAARLVALGGAGDNPADKPGLAGFTARMLTEGSETRSALKIADDLAQIGATLNATSDADQSSVSTQVLTRNLPADFNLLSDVVLHPAFQDEEIERIRSERATDLLQVNDDPRLLVSRVSTRLLYGDTSYGFPNLGTEASIKSTTRGDLEKFWSTDYVPRNSALVIAGDVTEAEARRVGEKYFGSWKTGGERSRVPEIHAEPSQSVYLVDKSGSAQTMLAAVTLGAPRSSPDYAALEVANAILGGLFSSRVNMNLREKHGYTYGAFSFFDYHRAAGPFYVRSSVRTDTTTDALREMFNEIAGMQTSPVTPDELKMAKDATSRSLAGLFESRPATVGTTSDLFTYDLPLDFFNTLPAKVESVAGTDVERVAKQYFVPERMFVVVIGDRQKIEAGLQGLNLGKIQLTSFEGTPAPDSGKPAPSGGGN